MPVVLSWPDVTLRLFCTAIAGIVIGLNRNEHGRPAGMRTTLLVCLAAAVAMIQANLLMHTVGKTSDSFIVLDLMRLPLGILSGMGFIGAGAILRKENRIVGVTTAATLWFSTVIGLCFGGGQIALGFAAMALGYGTLEGLKRFEKILSQDIRATLIVAETNEGPDEEDIRARIAASGGAIVSWTVAYFNHGRQREFQVELLYRIRADNTHPPVFVAQLAEHLAVEKVQWQPQGASKQ